MEQMGKAAIRSDNMNGSGPVCYDAPDGRLDNQVGLVAPMKFSKMKQPWSFVAHRQFGTQLRHHERVNHAPHQVCAAKH